jgi:multiple sugar transport system permease protein
LSFLEIKSPVRRILVYGLLILVVAIIIMPLVWMVITSFKPKSIVGIPYILFFEPSLENYYYVTNAKPTWKVVADTTIVAASTSILSLLVGAPAAYALSRYSFRGRDDLAFWMLTFWMSPPVAFAIPLFVIYDTLKLVDTYPGIILAHTIANLPFVVWLLREYIRDIPREVEEAALVDGASDISVFVRVTLPLLRPGLAAVGVLAFVFSWTEFLYALIFTHGNVRMLTVEVSSYWTIAGVLLGPMTAAITISIIPAIVFAILLQKHVVRGLTLGAVRD